jgi:hypothetical protein
MKRTQDDLGGTVISDEGGLQLEMATLNDLGDFMTGERITGFYLHPYFGNTEHSPELQGLCVQRMAATGQTRTASRSAVKPVSSAGVDL